MEHDAAWLVERLGESAREGLGRELEVREAEALLAYASELLAWAARINLTGARTVEELVDVHLADALMLAPHLPGDPAHLVDVGSGAGLPGVVVAILRPDLRVTLLEPTGKKLAFLRNVRRKLQLENLECRALRLEDLPAGEVFDVAVSRATWPPAEWLERARPLVAPGGRILALEGQDRIALPPGATRHPYRLANRDRAIIVLQK